MVFMLSATAASAAASLSPAGIGGVIFRFFRERRASARRA